MARRGRTLKIFDTDDEYSRTIEDVSHFDFAPVADSPAEPAEQTVMSEAPVQADPGREGAAQQPGVTPDKPKQPQTAPVKRKQPEPAAVSETKALVQVRALVRPLARHQKDLEALEQAGYQIGMILRLARQRTQKRIKIVPSYEVAEKSERGKGLAEYLHFRVSKGILEELSEQAGDLGTLPETELLRSQYQPIWFEELDTVIADLKRKLS
ncbi:hypothetical protein [Paracoccus aeridis]|uniref:hypothetical protein n=1 Tax=Paracoccus aeridis TaxID=1966466 RepID=UPI0010AA1357|nr:hypothetical protein [Paracoccus aeridis]